MARSPASPAPFGIMWRFWQAGRPDREFGLFAHYDFVTSLGDTACTDRPSERWTSMLKRAIHVGTTAVAVVAVFAILAGTGACGAPEFTYVKNSGQKTYFKVRISGIRSARTTLAVWLTGPTPARPARACGNRCGCPVA